MKTPKFDQKLHENERIEVGKANPEIRIYQELLNLRARRL